MAVVARVGLVGGVSLVCGVGLMAVMIRMVLVVRSCRHTSPLAFAVYIQTRTPNASRAPPVLSPAARAMSAVPKYLLCQTTPTYGASSRRTR